jgi:hypothetical protein
VVLSTERSKDALSLVFRSHGLRIGIELDDPELFEPVADQLPPGELGSVEGTEQFDRTYRIAWLDDDASPRGIAGYQMYVDDEPSGVTISVASVIAERLESSLQIYIAEFADPHLFLHSGVVQWHGKTIVLPGKSHAGKSTLVRALVNAGATYFSDEFAVLDHEGRVLPYPRKLSHREGPLGPSGRIDMAAHTPDLDGNFEPLGVDLVALIRYEAGSQWEATQLRGAEAVVAMSEHMVPIRRRPAETLTMLARVVDTALVYRCIRPDLDTAIAWINALTRD